VSRIFASLRTRMLAAHLLVIILGAGTLIVLAELLAPSFFSDDLQRMNDMMTNPDVMSDMMADPNLMSDMMTESPPSGFITPSVEADLQEAFDSSFRRALAISLVIAGIAAMAVSRFTTRRILAPLESVRLTTRRLADGEYDQRITPPEETELADLADDVNALAESLETTELRRVRLISELAHELRTPLSTIEGYVEGLIDGVFEPNDEIFAASGREIRRLKRLADDLGELSRAEEGSQPLEISSFDLSDLASEVCSNLGAQAQAKDIQLVLTEVRDQVLVSADRDRIVQVVTNIIGNSIAYTEPHGRISLSVYQDHSEAVVEVTDTGRGLTQEERTAIFERFYRGNHTEPGGSGIGLTIARSIARQHGGDIEVASSGPAKGSTFRIRLPKD